MSYKKKNLADFKRDLANGLYEAAAGARRAVGKFDGWSDKERDAARKLIDARFGEASAPAAPAKKAAAKKVGKKAAAKKAAKAATPAPVPASKFKRVAKSPKKIGKKAAKKANAKTQDAPVASAAAPTPAAAPPQAKAPQQRKGKEHTAAQTVPAIPELAPVREMTTSLEQVQRNLLTLKNIDPLFNVNPALSEVYAGLHGCAVRLTEIQNKYWPKGKSKPAAAVAQPSVPLPNVDPVPPNGAASGELPPTLGALPGFPVTNPH